MKYGLLFPAIAAMLLASGTAALAQVGKPGLYEVEEEEKPGLYELPQVTAEELIGRWGDNGDCTKDVIFRADGTFLSYTGGEGLWLLDDDRLLLNGPGGEFIMRVRWDEDGRLVITNPDGSVGSSQRC